MAFIANKAPIFLTSTLTDSTEMLIPSEFA